MLGQAAAVDAPPPPSAASGPRVVRLCALVLAVVWVVAWWSFGIQVAPLLGTEGVLPMAEACAVQPEKPVTADAFAPGGAPDATKAAAFRAPSGPTAFSCALAPYVAGPFGNGVLFSAVALGILCATAAALGLYTRWMLVGSALPYLAFLVAAPAFFPSIGDKLLVEVTLLVACLPRDRSAPLPVALARGALVKLYWGMVLAQGRAGGSAWQRGPAIGAFLQQVALPTRSGWYLAHLPAPLLTLATRLGLVVELCVPWLAFGPRAIRLAAALSLTVLQLGVANLVNDGLFAFAAIALHLLVLGDADVVAAQRDVARVLPAFGRWLDAALTPPPQPTTDRALRWARVQDALAACAIGCWLLLAAASLMAALGSGSKFVGALAHWRGGYTYVHAGTALEGRVEPIFEVQEGGVWRAVELWHQPGDPWRAPTLVLPHQPRLDAALSAAGRSRDGASSQRLLRAFAARLCRAPEGLDRLLRHPPKPGVQAVRWRFYSYAFADWAAHKQTGAFWTRAEVAEGETVPCSGAVPGHD